MQSHRWIIRLLNERTQLSCCDESLEVRYLRFLVLSSRDHKYHMLDGHRMLFIYLHNDLFIYLHNGLFFLTLHMFISCSHSINIYVTGKKVATRREDIRELVEHFNVGICLYMLPLLYNYPYINVMWNLHKLHYTFITL